MNRESEIRAQAAALGFSACGFAAAPPVERGRVPRRLARGRLRRRHALSRRAIPSAASRVAGILPAARTVISLAYPYAPPASAGRRLAPRRCAAASPPTRSATTTTAPSSERSARSRAPRGRVSARRTRRYVDTGAVLEREWAVRGGLGWFGKNTMLLGTRAGSWFFLAELVTEAALAPDAPTDEHCGRCTRCLDACPTRRSPTASSWMRAAASRTSRSSIAARSRAALRAALGPWIFGCDVCQEVCPWNAPARTPTSSATAFHSLPPRSPAPRRARLPRAASATPRSRAPDAAACSATPPSSSATPATPPPSPALAHALARPRAAGALARRLGAGRDPTSQREALRARATRPRRNGPRGSRSRPKRKHRRELGAAPRARDVSSASAASAARSRTAMEQALKSARMQGEEVRAEA